MKFLCQFLLLAMFVAYQAPILAQDEKGSAETTGSAEVDEDIPTEEFTNVGRKDNLRLSSGLAFSKIQGIDEQQLGWRGVFDYYVYDFASISGTAHLALNAVQKIRLSYMALGLNLHLFNLGDLGFFIGGSSGFSIFQHPTLPTKLTPAIDFVGGITYFTSFFVFTFEANHRRAEYTARNESYDLNQMLYAVSIGFLL